MPPPKSASTCAQCRARKVRCSGGHPCCSNCERLAFACSFSAPPGRESLSPAQLEKRRRPLACIACRTTKSKCTGERPSCEPCRTRSRDCAYPDVRRHKSRPEAEYPSPSGSGPPSRSRSALRRGSQMQAQRLDQPPEGATPPSPLAPPLAQALETAASELDAQSRGTDLVSPPVGSLPAPETASAVATNGSWQSPASNVSVDSLNSGLALPATREQLQMVNDYFRYLYALPGSAFLPEVSVTKRCLDGTIDETLLLALCAFTSSILKYPKYYPSHTISWVQRAEDLIWKSIETPTVFRTQALLLAVLCRVEMGNFKRGYMLLSMASRSASALRLHYERVDLDHLSREVRRRLTWSIMLTDSYFSVGLPESGTCPPDFIYLKMPCPEEDFHAGDAGMTSPSLDGVPEGGLLQLYLRLSIIRRDVMRLQRHLSVQANAMPQITALVEEMLKSLKLAEPPPYSAEELQRYANSRWLMRYVAVQIAWNQSHCDIYRLFISGYREAAPDAVIQACAPDYVARAAAACLGHARAVIDIIHAVKNLNLRLVSPSRDICIGGYHASRLLLFLSGSEVIPRDQNITNEEAVSLAKGTLEVLRLLFSSSEMLGKTVEDLDHIISTHILGVPGQPRDSSDEEPGGSRSRSPRFAMTIRRHTSLGVHSALRHARFHDDDEDARACPPESVSSGAAATHPASALAKARHFLPEPENADLGAFWGESALAAGEQLGVDMASPALLAQAIGPGPSAWDLNLWTAWGWQNDFSPGSSHDCI